MRGMKKVQNPLWTIFFPFHLFLAFNKLFEVETKKDTMFDDHTSPFPTLHLFLYSREEGKEEEKKWRVRT